jgi:hypothetical protein
LLLVWFVALPLATGVLYSSLLIRGKVLRSMVRPIARRGVLAADRAREVDSLYSEYAKAHPEDRSAQLQAAERRAERLRTEQRDARNRALIRRAQIDTTFDWRAESERSWLLRLSGMLVALVLQSAGLLTPIALVVLTIVWAVPRIRNRRRASA